MLEVLIPQNNNLYDETNEEFIFIPETRLVLEHSLISISKWESKYHKPYLKDDKNYEETIDYIKCMTINKVDDIVYYGINNDIIKQILDYIQDSMTATWFSKQKNGKPNNRIITSELIYYWMISLQIPFECEKWHLNRLLTLIRVCNEEQEAAQKKGSNKKLSKSALSSRAALNAARRSKYNSKG